ncbi:MAG: acyl carrier protein [Pirellulaceae bacterium]
MIDEREIFEIIAATLEVPLEKVTANADLLGDLGADSLALASLTAAIEEKTQLQLPMDAVLDIETVGDIIQQLQLAGK